MYLAFILDYNRELPSLNLSTFNLSTFSPTLISPQLLKVLGTNL